MLTVVNEAAEANQHTPAAVGGELLDELVRDGARQMLAAALQAEVAAYIEPSSPMSATATGTGWWSATATTQPRQVATAAGAAVMQPPGQRQARRSGNR